jgi:threonine dehydrogenase-like Zn-dependent dehydrogenase
MASKGGTVVIVGVPVGDVAISLPVVQDHQIRIQGSATYLPQDYAESIRLLTDGAVDVDAIVTAEVPLTRAADAYALSAGGEHVKVLVAVDDQLLKA